MGRFKYLTPIPMPFPEKYLIQIKLINFNFVDLEDRTKAGF